MNLKLGHSTRFVLTLVVVLALLVVSRPGLILDGIRNAHFSDALLALGVGFVSSVVGFAVATAGARLIRLRDRFRWMQLVASIVCSLLVLATLVDWLTSVVMKT